jgi:hypothetical protein
VSYQSDLDNSNLLLEIDRKNAVTQADHNTAQVNHLLRMLASAEANSQPQSTIAGYLSALVALAPQYASRGAKKGA